MDSIECRGSSGEISSSRGFSATERSSIGGGAIKPPASARARTSAAAGATCCCGQHQHSFHTVDKPISMRHRCERLANASSSWEKGGKLSLLSPFPFGESESIVARWSSTPQSDGYDFASQQRPARSIRSSVQIIQPFRCIECLFNATKKQPDAIITTKPTDNNNNNNLAQTTIIIIRREIFSHSRIGAQMPPGLCLVWPIGTR